MKQYTLYSYFRSSTSIRVRVALGLKQLDYRYEAISLLDNEQSDDRYRAVNPEGLVPALVTPAGDVLSQSMAIIEYLDDVYPSPALLPSQPLARARVRALAQIVGCDIHPINNLRILRYLKHEFGADQVAITAWFRRWAGEGCRALEHRLANEAATGRFCHGDSPTLADICLYAQVLNNRRFEVDMTPYPTLSRIFAACLETNAFRQADPEVQPDAR
ncbi:MAG: maleylacetoacetate isomerase [Pseudomonadota bacterium]